MDALLPLIADYQRFYEAETIDEERNRAFFSRFVSPSEDGMLLGAWRDGELLGYACLYWSFTSVVPAETVLMNDLFVVPAARGGGVRSDSESGSAAAVPATEKRLGIDGAAARVDLEVEVAADRAGVAGVADGTDGLAGEDPLAAVHRGRPGQVGVEVAAALARRADQQVVAVEDGVVAAAADPAAGRGDQRRAAGGDNIEALMGAPAAARRAELADVAARPVRTGDGKGVSAKGSPAIAGMGGRRGDEGCEQEERREGAVPSGAR